MPEALVKMQLVVGTFNQILVRYMYIFEPVYMVLATDWQSLQVYPTFHSMAAGIGSHVTLNWMNGWRL